MNLSMNILFAAVAAMALAAGGALLDGPSDAEVARMQAEDLTDAQRTAKLAAQRFERDYRACKRALGPSADLVQLADSDHYVCREMPIEPTPAVILSRYADLGRDMK